MASSSSSSSRSGKDNAAFVCTNKVCAIFVFILGFCLTVGGIIGLIVAPIASKQQVKSRIPVKENSFAASQWIDPPFIITMQLWLFNLSNADEVQQGIAKPSVVEKGPYTYKQKNQKNQVVYGANDTVSYIETNVFYFDQSRSCGDCFETDVFTVPNAVYTSLAHALRFQNEDIKRVVNLALLALSEKPFITKTVSQLMFKGFDDQLLAVVNALSRWIPSLEQMHLQKNPFQYFPKNNTNDGRYTINVGGEDVKKVGSILKWNGSPYLTYWSTPEANKIEGTDAQLFPPYLSRDDVLPIFVSDMCRSLYLRYLSDTHHDGLQAYRFYIPPEIFDSRLPENAGFCQPTDSYYPSQQDGHCLPPGLLNLTTCRGAPMIMSLPHFLFASDEVKQSIDGLNPSLDHMATWDIQPEFGAAVSVQTKFQINVPMHRDDIFLPLRQIKPAIIPLFWFNASAATDVGTRDYLYYNVVILQTVGYSATFAVLVFGLIFLMTIIGCCCRYRLRARARWSVGDSNNAHVNRALIEDNGEQSGNRWSTAKH